MRDRARLLVEKRDGRVEGLRATKIGRSIHRACRAARRPGSGRAVELAAAVLERLREGAPRLVRSADIAAAVQHVLLARGLTGAAGAYGHVGRRRRARPPLAAGGCVEA